MVSLECSSLEGHKLTISNKFLTMLIKELYEAMTVFHWINETVVNLYPSYNLNKCSILPVPLIMQPSPNPPLPLLLLKWVRQGSQSNDCFMKISLQEKQVTPSSLSGIFVSGLQYGQCGITSMIKAACTNPPW